MQTDLRDPHGMSGGGLWDHGLSNVDMWSVEDSRQDLYGQVHSLKQGHDEFQNGELERRIRRVLKSTVLGRRRVTVIRFIRLKLPACHSWPTRYNAGMDTVYIETSVISYLRQKPAKEVVTAAHQLLTHQWWDTERSNYDLVISQYVVDEASVGDPTLAADRLSVLAGIPRLPSDPEIDRIADEIMARAILPPRAAVDALRIATVAQHRIHTC